MAPSAQPTESAPRWLLRPISHWGDYGDVLIGGYAARHSASGQLLLHRGGPFAPPVFLPWGSTLGNPLVVADAVKQAMARAPFPAPEFRPALKHRIVHLPFAWERWDRHADRPARRPSGGEPSAYIWDEPHAPGTAAAMPDYWEVLPPVRPATVERLESATSEPAEPEQWIISGAGPEHTGLFRTRETWFDLVVDAAARDWFRQQAGEWLTFLPLTAR